MTEGEATTASRERDRRRERLALAGIVALCLALYLFAIDWGLPGTDSWAVDSIAPRGPLSILADPTGVKCYPAYPLMHFYVLAAAYVPYLLTLLATGGLSHPTATYPYGFADVVGSFTVLIYTARLVTVAMATTMVVLVWGTARRLFGGTSALVAALVVGTCCPVVFYAHTSNLDIPYHFWFVLSLWLLVKGALEAKLRYCILSGMAAAASAATKDQAGALVVGLPIVLWLNWGGELGREPADEARRGYWARARAIGWFVLAAALVYCCVNLLPSRGRFLHHTLRLFLGFKNVRQHPLTPWGACALLPDVMRVCWQSALLFAVAGGLGIVSLAWRGWSRRHLFWLVPMATYYFGFLFAIGYTFYRFTLPIVVCLAFPAGVFVAGVLGRIKPVAGRVALVAALAAPSLYQGVAQDLRMHWDTRSAAGAFLAERARQGDVVEVYRHFRYWPQAPRWLEIRKVAPREMTVAKLAQRQPDWVVVSEFQGRGYGLGARAAAYLDRLFGGETAYRRVGTFDLRFGPRYVYVAPRIDIFARRPTAPPGEE